MTNSATAKASASVTVVILYFLFLAHAGLKTTFTGDDFMNIAFLHGYGRVSLPVVVVHALSIFTPEIRPVGGLYYRSLFELFGLHPAPFRIAGFALLIANLMLAAVWYRRLSHSTMTAACAVLLFSFHPALSDLYYNNGTIYDVLCVFFVLLLLNYYVRIRQDHRFVTGNSLLLVLALHGAALGSKEMAVTMPAVLVLYEVIFHPSREDLRSRLWPVALLTLMTAVCIAAKTLVPNQMSLNPLYVPRYEAAFIGNSYLHYYRLLFLNSGLSAGAVIGAVILALLLAVVLRNRLMMFGLLFANLTLFTVCVIAPRGGFVLYMPMLGYALYGGAAISLPSNRIARMSKPGLPVHATLFAALVLAACMFFYPHAQNLGAALLPEQEQLSTMLAAVKKAAPTLPRGSRVLIESDPRREVWWTPLFLIRLAYEDPTIWVERVPNLGDNYDSGDVSLYDMRVRWDGAQYEVILQSQTMGTPVNIAVTPETPDVYGAVRRGQTARVKVPGTFANCTIDVAYRMPDDELMRGGVWLHWTESDADGNGRARLDVDAERGRVIIDRLRACGRSWVPARASSFTVDP